MILSEVKHIEKQFLDIWAESHSASTIEELREYETRAWKKFRLIVDHYAYRCTSSAQISFLELDLLKSMDFKSTGHPAPKASYSRRIWICDIFKYQRDKIELRKKSMGRMKYGNKKLRGRF